MKCSADTKPSCLLLVGGVCKVGAGCATRDGLWWLYKLGQDGIPRTLCLVTTPGWGCHMVFLLVVGSAVHKAWSWRSGNTHHAFRPELNITITHPLIFHLGIVSTESFTEKSTCISFLGQQQGVRKDWVCHISCLLPGIPESPLWPTSAVLFCFFLEDCLWATGFWEFTSPSLSTNGEGCAVMEAANPLFGWDLTPGPCGIPPQVFAWEGTPLDPLLFSFLPPPLPSDTPGITSFLRHLLTNHCSGSASEEVDVDNIQIPNSVTNLLRGFRQVLLSPDLCPHLENESKD